jgi:hypothetical protein
MARISEAVPCTRITRTKGSKFNNLDFREGTACPVEATICHLAAGPRPAMAFALFNLRADPHGG